VVTAYTLTFGGLLLLGGRVADYWGRKRTFIAGIIGFAIASALGGLAQNGSMLFAARALQGVFRRAARPGLARPADRDVHRGPGKGKGVRRVRRHRRRRCRGRPGARRRPHEYANWRWCLLVNIPVAVLAVVVAIPLVRESKAHGDTRYDIPGAVIVTAGLAARVRLHKASTDGWSRSAAGASSSPRCCCWPCS